MEDMNERKTISQIPVSGIRGNVKKCRELLGFLRERGFELHGLGQATDTEHLVALVVDLSKHEVFTTGVTAMACWCQGRRAPLNADEFMNHYERIVVKGDIAFYDALVRQKVKDDPRLRMNGIHVL